MSAVYRLRAWLRVTAQEHWLPLLLLVAPIFLVVWKSETATLLFVMIVPVTAFIIGAALQPRHVWLVWLGSVVIQWVAMGVFGDYSDPGPDETAVSLILEAFSWMALGVLLPCWLGRLVGGEVSDDRRRRETRRRMLP